MYAGVPLRTPTTETPSGGAVDEESSGARPGDIFGDKLGQAEIENFGLTALGDEDIRGLDVPMDDTSGVGNVEGIGNLNSEVEDLLEGSGWPWMC